MPLDDLQQCGGVAPMHLFHARVVAVEKRAIGSEFRSNRLVFLGHRY
jgi:hypothetical protein